MKDSKRKIKTLNITPEEQLKNLNIVVPKSYKGEVMKRYEYKFHTNNGIENITVKGKGIKQAIKEFNASFLTVVYINKKGKKIIKEGVK
tara:strand:+ start:209 stop:475 length:267 start_codon:yes stop_codon:yes gene_type:complete